MELGLAGRTAFVTGASRGIGAAIVKGLVAEGVRVASFCRATGDGEEVAREVRARYPSSKVGVYGLDLTDLESVQAAVGRAVADLGCVDILVNGAGGAHRAPAGIPREKLLDGLPDAVWLDTLAVKPIGAVRLTRAALPTLLASQQGRIINICGTRAKEPGTRKGANALVGSPANMALLGFTKALANQLGPAGITVNAVNPGTTRTRRWEELVALTIENEGVSRMEAEAIISEEVPLGRPVEPNEVAELVTFLASCRAAMISGVAINVDGGRSRSI